MRRAWTIFAATSAILLALQFAYMEWRERSLEPLSVPIDLSHTGRYSFDVGGFHSSEYHPELSLDLPYRLEGLNHFADNSYNEIWSSAPPPRVHIEVRDRSGRLVINETSNLTRDDGWIATFGLGTNEVELYKFAKFRARMMGSYRVSLEVLRGNPHSQRYRPRFQIAAIKAYALLGVVFVFLFLLVAVFVTAIVLGIVHVLHARDKARA
jgi:hypothetical protein